MHPANCPAVLSEPADRGEHPGGIPAPAGAACLLHRACPPSGVLPAHGTEQLQPTHPTQLNPRIHHQHRLVPTREGSHPACLYRRTVISPALPLLSSDVSRGRELACVSGVICCHLARTDCAETAAVHGSCGCYVLTVLLSIVSLKWRLHFEFVTSGESAGTCLVRGSQSEAVTWTGVEQMEVDTFSWDLPIKVLPTNPILASYVSQFSSTNSITI